MKHLKNVNESYFKHMKEALFIVFILIVSSIACFVHAIFPFLFTTTASKNIKFILSRCEKRSKNV